MKQRQEAGTSITARYAKEQGKEVFCIPNALDNPKGVGTNNLIKKGASLVQSPKDITINYGIYNARQIKIEELEIKNKEISINIEEIPKEYREMYGLLYEPLNVNEISIKAKMEVTEVYSMLFMMELEGLIKKHENKYVIVEKGK